MFCQNCKTPLKLDSSLEDLSSAAFNLLTDTSTGTNLHGPGGHTNATSRRLYTSSQKQKYDAASKDAHSPTIRRSTGAAAQPVTLPSSSGDNSDKMSRDHAAMSFVMLTESQVNPANNNPNDGKVSSGDNRRRNSRYPDMVDEENLLSHKMETNARLFEILSSRSDIDHPICTECTEILIDGMEKRLAGATSERDAYVEFLREANANIPTDEERLQVQRELESVQAQEAAAFRELEALEVEKAALERDLVALDLEARQLDEEEQIFWRERNAFNETLSGFQSERDSVNMRYDHDSRQLERLSRTNVYNDTFNISHDGSFGTINGLRLGRMPNVSVEWSEINAALGQCCLLLATVVDKLGIQLQGYRLSPVGSTSTVDKVDRASSQQGSTHSAASIQSAGKSSSANLPLYHSSDLPLNIGFLHRNFDNALIAFLDCVRQVLKHVERTTEGIKIPYDIKKDKFQNKQHPDQEYSIKLGFGGDESWTKACKCLLTCLKFLLAHASHVEKR